MSDAKQKNRTLGELELDALRFVSEVAPTTVGEMAKAYGTPRGLARTTILTVMERLREKGYLTRKKVDGIYRYSPKQRQDDLLQNLVADFVERSLGGSLSPFVAYLADAGKLEPSELEELRKLVETLEAKEAKRA